MCSCGGVSFWRYPCAIPALETLIGCTALGREKRRPTPVLREAERELVRLLPWNREVPLDPLLDLELLNVSLASRPLTRSLPLACSVPGPSGLRLACSADLPVRVGLGDLAFPMPPLGL